MAGPLSARCAFAEKSQDPMRQMKLPTDKVAGRTTCIILKQSQS